MNEVIRTICNHRSIRKFKNVPLTPEQVETIVRAAQMAPSSAYLQPFAVIGVTDESVKKQLAERSRCPALGDCGYLFLFCADLYRIMAAATDEEREKMKANLGFSYMHSTAVLSAALALQNANLAAESMGLGAVIVGGINSALPELDEWLDLPEYVIPLVGLAVGTPDEWPEQKPRLPLSAVFFENKYNRRLKDAVEQFDREVESYYETRSDNKQKANWSGKIIAMLTGDLPLEPYTVSANA